MKTKRDPEAQHLIAHWKIEAKNWKDTALKLRDRLRKLRDTDHRREIERMSVALANARARGDEYLNGLKIIQNLDSSCNYGEGKSAFHVCSNIAALAIHAANTVEEK